MDSNDLENKEEMEYELVSVHTVQEKKLPYLQGVFLICMRLVRFLFFAEVEK